MSKTFTFVKHSCNRCGSVNVQSELSSNWSKWEWHCGDCGYVCDYTKEQFDAIKRKSNKRGGL